MLRISLITQPDAVRLVLEGRLAEAWVPELEAIWARAEAMSAGRRLEVDLRELLTVDDSGRAMLARLVRSGARLLACGCAMREVVREIAETVPVEAGCQRGVVS